MWLLCKAGVMIKLKKSRLFAEIIDYLGHVIRPDHLKLAEHRTDAAEKL